MADSDLGKALLPRDNDQGKSPELLSATTLFKTLSNVAQAVSMKDDFGKATSYIRDLKPVMIDTPFKGSSLALTQDERFYVFGSREGRIGIADRETKQVTLDRDLNQGSIWTLTLINNDKYVLSAGASGTIKKFLYSDLSDVDEFLGHTDEINFIKVSADEKFMYTCSDDRTVREWDLNATPDQERSTTLFRHNGVIYCIDLSLDGTIIVSASGDRTVKVYNLDSKSEEATLTGHQSAVWCVKVSARKNFVASGDQSGVINVWEFGTWTLTKSLRGHDGRVRYMDMALDESFVVTGGLDHTIKIWDMKRQRKEITLKGHQDWVKFTLISKNQGTIFSISDDCKVASWRIPKFDNQIYFEHTDSFSRLDVPNASVYARTSNSVQEYSLINGQKVREFDLSDIKVIHYSFSKSGDRLFVFGYIGSEKQFITYSLLTGEKLSNHTLKVDQICSAYVYPNEEFFAVGQEVRLYVFRLSDLENTKTFRAHKSKINLITSSPDSLTLFSADTSSKIKVYDTVKNIEIGALEQSGMIKLMQVSKCGNYFCVASSGELSIYTTTRLQVIHKIPSFTADKLVFTNDFSYFFHNSSSGMQIRDLNTFEVVTSVQFTSGMSDFVLSPDEKLCIVTSGKRSTVFANPLKCDSVSLFGNWEDTYGYVDYVNDVVHSKATHKPEYDHWVIEPFHINTLHLYAHYNQPHLLNKAVVEHSPFYPTRTGHTPLQVSLDKNFMECVEGVYKGLKQRIEAGDNYAFYYIGLSLVSLNKSGFENLHRIYELALRQCHDPTLPRFCFEDTELPYGISSHGPIVNPSEFAPVFAPEGTAIVIAQSSFRISMNMGSQESIDLLDSIIECSNESIYSTTVVQMILKNKWKAVRWVFVLQTVIYCLYLASLAVYSSAFWNDKLFLLVPFGISLVLFLYELIQMLYNGFEYFTDPWNFIDLFRGLIFVLYCSLVWTGTGMNGNEDATEGTKGYFAYEVFSLLVLSSWLKGITYFRVFEKTRYLINLIMEAIVDIINFFIILFYSTIAFTLIYQGLHESEDSLSTQFANSFKLNLGDLNQGTDSPLMFVLFLIVSIVNPIIMLNLLISIMGDTYGRVKEGRIVADTRELAQMVLEVEDIMGWKKELNEKFFIKIVCEESFLKAEDESVVAKLKGLKDKVQALIGQVAETKDSVIQRISQLKSSIIDSL